MRPKERRESGQNGLFLARLDQISTRAIVGEAHASHRLAVSRGAVPGGLFGQDGAPAAADAAHGGLGDPQVDARPVRRGCASAGSRPRTFCCSAARSSSSTKRPSAASRSRAGGGAWARRSSRRARRAWRWRRTCARRSLPTFQLGHCRDDPTAACGRLLDRRQAHAPGALAASEAGEEYRRELAPML
jgi:hypothetical protein